MTFLIPAKVMKRVIHNIFLAHQIEKSDVLPWVRNSYITRVISPKAHVLLLNIGCIGRHVTSSLRLIVPLVSFGTPWPNK